MTYPYSSEGDHDQHECAIADRLGLLGWGRVLVRLGCAALRCRKAGTVDLIGRLGISGTLAARTGRFLFGRFPFGGYLHQSRSIQSGLSDDAGAGAPMGAVESLALLRWAAVHRTRPLSRTRT